MFGLLRGVGGLLVLFVDGVRRILLAARLGGR